MMVMFLTETNGTKSNKEQGGCFCIDMSELSSNIDFYAIFESTDGIIDKKG